MQKTAILVENNIGTLNFYKRTRIKEFEIQILSTTDKFEYSSLLFSLNNGEFPNYSITSNYQENWANKLSLILNHTILALIIQERIKLFHFEDEKKVLGLFNWKSPGYRIDINHKGLPSGILTRDFFKCITLTNNQYGVRNDLKKLISEVFDDYLGKKGTYSKPGKEFIIELLRKFSINNIGLNYTKEKKMFGLYYHHHFSFNATLSHKIKDEFDELAKLYKKLIKTDRNYARFVYQVEKLVISEINSRHPKG